jgi:hypothetical protein
VNSGTGDGTYAAGTVVNITADAPAGGQVFSGWTGATVANPNAASTTLTMPAANTTVTATYTNFFVLTVNNGTGSGAYAAGTLVPLSANPPTTGQTFDRWTGATVANALATSTTLSMPASSATVTATYKAITVGNNPPVLNANPSAAPNPVITNAIVTFNATASDPDNDTLTYVWTFSNGALPASGASVTKSFAAAGVVTATVTVTDGKGGSVSGDVAVTVNAPAPGNNSPTVTSAASAAPNPASILAAVAFSVAASDQDGDALSFLWDYGDGSSDATGSHSYASAGIYNVNVVVSDGRGGVVSSSILLSVQAGAVTALDLDGDGFSNALEEVLGTNPLNPGDAPAIAPAVLELLLLKVSIALNFKNDSFDSAKFSGVLPVPANFNSNGQLFAVDVGGKAFLFALTDKAKGTSPTGVASLRIKKKKGVVAEQMAAYSFSLKKAQLAGSLDDEGLQNADLKQASVSVLVQVFFNAAIHQATVPLSYSARVNSSGRAKKK